MLNSRSGINGLPEHVDVHWRGSLCHKLCGSLFKVDFDKAGHGSIPARESAITILTKGFFSINDGQEVTMSHNDLKNSKSITQRSNESSTKSIWKKY